MNKRMMGIGLAMLMSAFAAHAGLLLRYNFNYADTNTTVAYDTSGNTNNGVFDTVGTSGVARQTGIGVSGLTGDYAYNGTSATGMGVSNATAGLNSKVRYTGTGLNSSQASLTICGWFKTDGAALNTTGARLFASSTATNNSLSIGTTSLGFWFQLGNTTVAISNSVSPYNTVSEWTFFAVTYDSNQGSDNVNFYVGNTNDNSVTLAATRTITGEGVWDGASATTADFCLGNRQGAASANTLKNPFDGYMDDFRLYGGATDSSGALSLEQLEVVRGEAIPEPTTVSLFMIASGAVVFLRRRTICR